MKILIAIDGSKYSDKAVEIAIGFALSSASKIMLITVIETAFPVNFDIYGSGYIPQTAEFEKVARENALSILEKATQRINEHLTGKTVVVSTEVLSGSPESQIVETAENMQADLIIVGSHGYNTWERMLLGSVSDSVVHHAPCSVLVVRASKE